MHILEKQNHLKTSNLSIHIKQLEKEDNLSLNEAEKKK